VIGVALPDIHQGDAVEVAAWFAWYLFDADKLKLFEFLFGLADSTRRHFALLG
jgi:hypothetical protein